MSAIHGRHAFGSHAEEALGASAALRSGVSRARPHEALGFEPIKSGVDGADGHLATGSRFDLPPDPDAVGLLIETQNREKDDVLEFAEVVATGHYSYNIE